MLQLFANQTTLLAGTISLVALLTEITILHITQLIGKPSLNCTVTNSHSMFRFIASRSHKIQVKMNRETTVIAANQPGDEGHQRGPLIVGLILPVYLWGLEVLGIQSPAGRQHPSLLGGQAFPGFQGNLDHLLWARPMVSVRKT